MRGRVRVRIRRNIRRGVRGNQVRKGVEIDRTYRVNNKVGVDVSVKLELTSKSESKLKLSRYQGWSS